MHWQLHQRCGHNENLLYWYLLHSVGMSNTRRISAARYHICQILSCLHTPLTGRHFRFYLFVGVLLRLSATLVGHPWDIFANLLVQVSPHRGGHDPVELGLGLCLVGSQRQWPDSHGGGQENCTRSHVIKDFLATWCEFQCNKRRFDCLSFWPSRPLARDARWEFSRSDLGVPVGRFFRYAFPREFFGGLTLFLSDPLFGEFQTLLKH